MPVPEGADRSTAQPAIEKPFETVAPLAGVSIATRPSRTVNVTSMPIVIVRSGLVEVILSVPW